MFRHHVHTRATCLETHCLLWDYMVGWGFLCLNWVIQNWERSMGGDPQRVKVKSLYSLRNGKQVMVTYVWKT